MRKFLLFAMALLFSMTAFATDYPGHPGFVGKTVYVDDEGFPVGEPGLNPSEFDFTYCFEYGYIPGEEMPVAILLKTKYETENGLFQLPTYYSVWDEDLNTTLWIKVIGISADQLFWSGSHANLVTQVEMPMYLEFIVGNGALSFPKITSLTLPESLEYMDANALNQCTSLTDLTIADSNKPLNIIGSGAAFRVPPLVNAYIGKTVIASTSPFKRSTPTLKHVTLGGVGQAIYDEMFSEQTLLETATLKNGVGSIGKKAFYNCTALTGIAIPGTATRIGQSAFENDSAMTTLTIAEGVKAINQYAFTRCSKVASLTLPASLDSIHAEALTFMSGVTSFSMADGNTPLEVYGYRWWGNGMCNDFAAYEGHLGRNLVLSQSAKSPFYHADSNVGGLTKLTISNQVTTLPEENAFFSNRNLATATIGTGLKAIPKKAFLDCVGLKGISIPGNVKRIGESAFENDSSMTTLTIAEGVKAIEPYAFTRCSKVTSLTLPASLDSIHAEALQFMSGVSSFSMADGSTPLEVYGYRWWGNGMCNDFAAYEGHLGRNLVLSQSAISPFYHADSNVGGLTKLTIGNQVTTLPEENAFYRNRNLTTATIGTGLTAIPKQAFLDCTGLRGIRIPGNVKRIGQSAFANDSSMTTLTIAEGVKAIEPYAFTRCSKVTSLTLPASLDSIHAEALQFMSSVTSFSITDNSTPLKVYGYRWWSNGMCNDFAAYEGHLGRNLVLSQSAISPFYHADSNEGGLTKLTIGNQVTTLPEENAFYRNRNLTTATIGTGLTAIPKQAFLDCTGLRGIRIPGNVKRIGQSAFANDSAMTTLTLAEGVKAIEPYAFTRCSKVTSLTLPASLDSIHADALQFMSSVTSFTITDSSTPLKVYGNRYWSNGMCNDFAPYEGYLGRDLTLTRNAISPFYHADSNVGGLTKLTIGNQVTTLPEKDAFYRNHNLATATIGTGLTAIPQKAFLECTGLRGISIPGNVKRIGESAFQNDSVMTTLTLAEGVKAIDYCAFTNCSKVTSLTLPASLDSIHADALRTMSGVTSFTITDSSTPLKVYGYRYWGNGMCKDFALVDAYVGRDFTLTQNALSPFYNQSTVATVTLGTEITTLVNNQFYNCKQLRDLTCNAVEPPVCAANAFSELNPKEIALTVPAASKNKYKAAPVWMLFFDEFIPGDLNGDGNVNAGDVSSLYLAILYGETDPIYDVNGDGLVNAGDVSAIYAIILGQ